MFDASIFWSLKKYIPPRPIYSNFVNSPEQETPECVCILSSGDRASLSHSGATPAGPDCSRGLVGWLGGPETRGRRPGLASVCPPAPKCLTDRELRDESRWWLRRALRRDVKIHTDFGVSRTHN